MRALVLKHVVPERRETVLVLSDAVAAAMTTDVKAQTAQALIARISTYPPQADNRLFVERDVECSIMDLTAWWRDHAYGHPAVRKLSPAAMRRELIEHLRTTGGHWRDHALAEIRRFEGRRGNLDAWLQQFGELGQPDIGRKLAAQLRVIRTGELPTGAFSASEADVIGLRRINCYVEDGDPGGSWLEMKSLLEHSCPRDTVHAANWDEEAARLTLPDVPADEILIYEDGLWSGKEVVKRLVGLREQPGTAIVKLRFAVVTDFGLMVARQAIRAIGLEGRISVDTTKSELLRFMDPGNHGSDLGLDVEPDTFYADLHQHVRPFAFRRPDDWTASEIEFCENIGGQLVRTWLQQSSVTEPSAEKVARFALGGGRFASTVAFSRSVPKVCLPLLWLDGPVAFGGRSVAWRPLLVDARRVTEDALLRVGGSTSGE